VTSLYGTVKLALLAFDEAERGKGTGVLSI